MSSKTAKKSNVKKTGNVYTPPAERPAKGRWMMIPAALIFGYVPLIMRTYQYDPGMSQFEWFDDGQVVDVYMASKMFVILIIGFVMLAMFLLHRLIEGEKFKFDKILVPLYVFFGGVLLSGILSHYKSFAWGGSFEMFESVPVALLYVFTAIYIFRQMRDMGDFMYFWHIVSPGILIEGLICSFQHWGKDFIDTHFAKYLYLSPPYWPQMDTMTTGMGDASYGTLYNPDFLPMYFAAAIPIAAAAFFGVTPPRDAATMALQGKSEKFEFRRYTWERIYCAVILGFCILGLYGGGRTNGVFVMIAMGIILILGDRIVEKKQLIMFLLAGVILVGATIGVSFTDTKIGNSIKTALNETEYYPKDIYVEDFHNKADEVEFIVDYKGTDYVYHATMELVESQTQDPNTGETTTTVSPVATLTCDNMDGITITQAEGNPAVWYTTREDDPGYSFTVTAFNTEDTFDEATGEQTAVAAHGLTITGTGITWTFNQTADGFKFKNPRGMEIDFPSDVEYVRVFPEHFFHGRGHIYNYTIPKLRKHILFGSGSNTFIFEYPQNDYLTESYHSLDVKPHCFYIQQWVENGLLATVALVVFLIWLVFALLKILVTPTEDAAWKRGGFWRGLTLASIALIVGVMIAWLTNDSNVCSSPIDWAGFGIALACYKKGSEMTGKEGK